MADLAEVTEKLRAQVGDDSGLGGSVKFDFGDEGVILVDGGVSPNTVTNEDNDADCTIAVSMDDFKEMATGNLDPTMAFMQGKLKVDGDMGLAMKLGPLLQG